MATLCTAPLRNCPKCKARFQRGKQEEVCPYCGTDLHCTHYVVPGYNYCSNHGGPSPARGFYGLGRGMTTGAKSSFQLTRIAASYNEIQGNGRILSNRKAMEIIWKRVEQLAERIDLNEAPERMAKIKSLWEDFREKSESGNEIEAKLICKKIDEEFEAAYHDYMAWKQMFEALEIHSKMTESEVKIMKDLRAIMTAEDAYELVAKVMAVMLEVLRDDPKRLKEAQFALTRIIGETGGRFGGGSREIASSDGPGEVDRERVFDPGDQE